MYKPLFDYSKINYLRALAVLGAVLIPVTGIVLAQLSYSLHDPMELRILGSSVMLLFLGLSFIKSIRYQILDIMLLLVLSLSIVWANYLLYINNLSQTHTLNLPIVLFAFSLIIERRNVLFFYVSAHLIMGSAAIWLAEDPSFDQAGLYLGFIIICLIDYVAINRNIDKNHSIHRANENFKFLVDNVGSSLFLLDKDLNIVQHNEFARSNFMEKLNFEVAERKNLRDLIPQKYLADFDDFFSKAMKGKPVDDRMRISYDPDEEWLEFKAVPILDSKTKDVDRIIFSIRSIEKDIKRQLYIKTKNRELQKVNEELDRFVYRAAHDLRAPLASVMGLVSVSKMESNPETINNYLDMINKSVNRLDDFIQDILDYSRNAKAELNLGKVDVESLIRRVVQNSQTLIQNAGVEVEITCNCDIPFYSDESRMEVLLNNLLTNAIKYRDNSKPRSWIKIEASVSKKAATLIVEDNGPGIKEKDQKRIFELFYRANDTVSGSGLGLFIVKETIEKLHGSINLDSEFLRGSKFTCDLKNLTNAFRKKSEVPDPKELDTQAVG